MSIASRNKNQPEWMRIRMMAHSQAHRSMKKQTLGLQSNLCPVVTRKFDDYLAGKMNLDELRAWLGQVHTDYVQALERAHEKHIKVRIRLRDAERVSDTRLSKKEQGENGRRWNIMRHLGMTLEDYDAKVAEGLKHCSGCKTWIPVGGFSIHRARKDGLYKYCRKCCQKQYQKRRANRDKLSKKG